MINVKSKQKADRRSEPERKKEPLSSKQQTKVSENTGKQHTTGNESVRPRDGSQRNGKIQPCKVNKENSCTKGSDTTKVVVKGSEPSQGNKSNKTQEKGKSKSSKNNGKKSSNVEANKDVQKQSAKEGANSNTGNNNKDNQTQQKTSQNSNDSKQKKQDKKGIIPSCIDCKAGSCKPINEKDIKAIVSSQRSNGALYYKLKWLDNSTDWYFPCKIPGHLIREYHANRTMSGKKRKKPLHDKQHKFFTENEHQVNVTTKPKESAINQNPVLLAVKIINGRSYYLVKNGNSTPQWQPMCMAHYLAADMIDKIFREREDLLYRCRVQGAQESNKPQNVNRQPPNHLPTVKYIHEMELREDGHWYCLISFTKSEVPPDWQNLNDLPPGLTNRLIEFLSKENETYVKTDPYAGF